MKNPSDLSKKELVNLVLRIRDHLYLDYTKASGFTLNPHMEWDQETVEKVASELHRANLVPKRNRDLK